MTSQFTVPSVESFSGYVTYSYRKEALKQKDKLTEREEFELRVIEASLDNYKMEEGKIYRNKQKGDIKETEAQGILNADVLNDYEKYISYMSRQSALLKKTNLSADEELELSQLKKVLSEPDEENNPILSGAFSCEKKTISKSDITHIKDRISKAQNNGSVFFQDVISFDQKFMIDNNIYNPESKELDEEKIQTASRKMMDKLFEAEGIDSGFWFASIHRNTDHIHIHFGSVEDYNTREIITYKRNGIEYHEPKGKRKLDTINQMKSSFANALVDRTANLARMTELRNTMVDNIKVAINAVKTKNQEVELLESIKHDLPKNMYYWKYASLPARTREKIDEFVNWAMKDSPYYSEYLKLAENEKSFRKEVYGESNQKNKDYLENSKKDIHKRLGNSLLKALKEDSTKVFREDIQSIREIYSKTEYHYEESIDNNKAIGGKREKDGFSGEFNSSEHFQNPSFRTNGKRNIQIINRKEINHIKRAIRNDYEKYRAEYEFKRTEYMVALQQQRQK